MLNVLVAWGCALWIDPGFTISLSRIGTSREPSSWNAIGPTTTQSLRDSSADVLERFDRLYAQFSASGQQRMIGAGGLERYEQMLFVHRSMGVEVAAVLLLPVQYLDGLAEEAGGVRAGWPFLSLQGFVVGQGEEFFRSGEWQLRQAFKAPAFLHPVARHPRSLALLPVGIIWPGTLANIAVFASVLWLAGGGFTRARRSYWRKRNRCPACGYSRAGLAANAPCPECGGAGAGASGSVAQASRL